MLKTKDKINNHKIINRATFSASKQNVTATVLPHVKYSFPVFVRVFESGKLSKARNLKFLTAPLFRNAVWSSFGLASYLFYSFRVNQQPAWHSKAAV